MDLKEIQKVELLILEQVKIICEKHNLQYFADSGTLLGIVRNNSFIPWDNDIDLAMPRKDYQKFIKYAEKELPEPYYLQTGYKDKGFYSGLLKIRKSDTTAILKDQFPAKKFNQGVFLDIFPLDKTLKSKKLTKIQLKILFFCKSVLKYKSTKSLKTFNSFSNKFCMLILTPFIFILPQKFFYLCFEFWGRIGNITNSKYCDKILFRGYHKSKKIKPMPVECYENSETVTFEDTTISIPTNSEIILTTLYGNDYMTPRQEPDDHGEIFFDLNNSYLRYLNNELKIDFNDGEK